MTRTAEAVLADVLALPGREQRRVLVALLERLEKSAGEGDGASTQGVEDGYDAAWAAELKVRVDRLDQGLDQALPWEDVLAEAKARVAEVRRRG